jgi:RNA methyltransferase, TrmH family
MASNLPALPERRLKEIASLSMRKYRVRLEEYVIEGVRLVESALVGKAAVREIVVTPAAAGDPRVRVLINTAGVPVSAVSEREMSRLSDVETSQGVLAVAGMPRSPTGDLDGGARVLALDGVGDPGNAGTLIRTAAWFGIDRVVFGPGSVDPYSPKVVRAAMGGLWDVAVFSSGDLAGDLGNLRAAGFRVYGADLSGRSCDEWRPEERSVLVIGSEAHGLSDGVRQVLDEAVRIPAAGLEGAAESLNAAVAGGILLYEWTRRPRS